MASKGGDKADNIDNTALLAAFKAHIKLAAAGKELSGEEAVRLNVKACGKMAKDTMPKIKDLVDSSVFSAMKEKGKPYVILTAAKCNEFVLRCAAEHCKKNTKDPKVKFELTDEKVIIQAELYKAEIVGTGPKTTSTAVSKVGGVDRLTDAKGFTGSHRERFDADTGKGRGKAGRENLHENTGYVGQYKGKDTFDRK